MEPLENERFEDAWRRAFDGAEQAPGEGLWGRIERQLPPERGKRRPVVWWWAAAASLLLTLLAGGLGWWAGRQNAATDAQVATTQTAPTAPSPGTQGNGASRREPSALTQHPEVARQPAESGATATVPALVPEPISTRDQLAKRNYRPNALGNEAVRPGAFSGQKPVSKAPVAELPRLATRPASRAARREVPARPEASPAVFNPLPAPAEVAIATVPEAERTQPVLSNLSETEQRAVVDFLTRKAVQLPRVALRVQPPTLPSAPKPLFMPPPPQSETAKKSSRGSRFWASVGAAPVGFDPRVRLGGGVAAVASAATASNSFYNTSIGRGSLNAPLAESRPALSYRVGGRVGWQMSDHWSLESGVEYLNGQSTLQSGLVLVNRATNESTSLFADALSNKSNAAYDVGTLAAQNSFVPTDNQLRSTYQYVSVPVQVGYRLWPESRMEALLSAGLAGDVFLSNTLQPTGTSNLSAVRYAASDGVYRQLLWSGLGGLGLRYRLDTHWGLGLNGTFRRALTSGVQSSSGVQTFPRELGVGMRVDYRF